MYQAPPPLPRTHTPLRTAWSANPLPPPTARMVPQVTVEQIDSGRVQLDQYLPQEVLATLVSRRDSRKITVEVLCDAGYKPTGKPLADSQGGDMKVLPAAVRVQITG